MSSDRRLKGEIDKWVEDSSPAAPWLEQNVLEAVRASVNRPEKVSKLNFRSSRLLPAGAFLIGMATVATLLLGAQAIRGQNDRASQAASVHSYRATADADWAALYLATHASDEPCMAFLASICRERKDQVRSSAAAFLADIEAARVPTTMDPINAILVSDLQRLISHMNRDMTLLANNPSLTSDGFDFVDVDDLADVMAQIDCWPSAGTPTSVNDFASRKPPPVPICSK